MVIVQTCNKIIPVCIKYLYNYNMQNINKFMIYLRLLPYEVPQTWSTHTSISTYIYSNKQNMKNKTTINLQPLRDIPRFILTPIAPFQYKYKLH